MDPMIVDRLSVITDEERARVLELTNRNSHPERYGWLHLKIMGGIWEQNG